MLISSLDWPGNATYQLSLLTLGGARCLFLPGEPFVECQLYAQSLIADESVALAANCGDNFLYLPLAEHLSEGGYETTSFCWCNEQFEGHLEAAMTDLLGLRNTVTELQAFTGRPGKPSGTP